AELRASHQRVPTGKGHVVEGVGGVEAEVGGDAVGHLEAALHAGVETELAGAVERVAAGITEGAGRRGGKGRGVEETGAGVERLAGEFGAHAGEAGAGEHAKGGRGEGQA